MVRKPSPDIVTGYTLHTGEHNEKYKTDISHLFTHIIHELEKPFSLESAKKFLHVSQQVDNVRNENIFDVVPELKIIKDQLGIV